jgi:hypothetical protein
MIRNKSLDILGSLEDETFKRPSKRAKRKSHREAREEEAERKNARQPTHDRDFHW